MKHYKNNPRKISKRELRQLRADLEELGDLGGFVHNLETDEFVGGNQRSEAIPGVISGKLQPIVTQRYDPPNAQGTVAVGFIEWQGEQFKYRAVRWDDATARRANIRANKAGGDWDWDALSAWDASELTAWGFDGDTLKDWGSNVAGLGALLGSEEAEQEQGDAEPQIDKAAELQEKWQTETGQLWQLGEHRLLIGDCTVRENVERLMGGEMALVFSDAPYGVAIVRNNKVGGENLAPVGNYSPIVGDETTDTARAFYSLCLEIGFSDFILWGGNYFTDFLKPSSCWIVWDKRGDMNSNNFADCELAWCSYDKPARVYKQVWAGMIREGEHDKRVHPTQKPVRVTQEIMSDFPADIYFDGFAGSGTTIIAAQNLNRRCYAMEISEKYGAVILQRFSDAFPDLEITRYPPE